MWQATRKICGKATRLWPRIRLCSNFEIYLWQLGRRTRPSSEHATQLRVQDDLGPDKARAVFVNRANAALELALRRTARAHMHALRGPDGHDTVADSDVLTLRAHRDSGLRRVRSDAVVEPAAHHIR